MARGYGTARHTGRHTATTHDEGTDGSVADDLDLTEVWTRALDSLGDEGMTAQQRAFV